MDTPATPVPAPDDLMEVLAASDADIAAGRVYELEDVLREIDDDIAALLENADETETFARLK